MESQHRNKRGLLPGLRTEASPALNRPDVPFDIVGPLIAFHGCDLAAGEWKGSVLVLVRREPRALGELEKGKERYETQVKGAVALSESPTLVALSTADEAEQSMEMKEIGRDPKSTAATGIAQLGPQDSSVTMADDPPADERKQLPEDPKQPDLVPPIPLSKPKSGIIVSPLRRTSSHEIEHFRPSSDLKNSKRKQLGSQPVPPSPLRQELASDTSTTELATPDIAEQPTLEYSLHYPDSSPCSSKHTLSEPTILYTDVFGYTAFRFDLTIPQDRRQTTIVRYRLRMAKPERYIAPHNELGEYDFHVPSTDEKWHAVFFSCSGFEHTNRQADQGVGTPGLWHDILRIHKGQKKDEGADGDRSDDIEEPRPFHLLIGGGDQIYQDDVFDDVKELNSWMYKIPYQAEREAYPWSAELEHATELFYFRNACIHFGTTVVGDAMARIPHLFVPDDHDFFDGIGSYPEHLNNCPVFQGIAKVATRQFLLFQHHATAESAGSMNGMIPAATNGPMGRPHGYNFVYNMSPTMSIVGLDNRTERQIEQVFYPETMEAVFNCIESTIPPTCQHLLVIQAVPMIFGDIGALERPLEKISRFIRGSKFVTDLIAKCGLYKNDQLKFGEPQLLDDCIDHWTSLHHIAERQTLFARFGEIATSRHCRVSWLTGDVHCAGFGRLRTIGTTAETELWDPMTMYQVISSAIGNAPPPVFVRWLFELTDGPPWGIFRKYQGQRRASKPPEPQEGVVGSKVLKRAGTYYEKMQHKYAADFVGRPLKQDKSGQGQVILGQVEEGLVRIGELELVAGHRGGKIRHNDKETRSTMKRKLLRRRNWCEITQVEPDANHGSVGTRTVLEFALHVERLRELKHMLKIKGGHRHDDLAEIDADTNVPATNVWRARVVGLEPRR